MLESYPYQHHPCMIISFALGWGTAPSVAIACSTAAAVLKPVPTTICIDFYPLHAYPPIKY